MRTVVLTAIAALLTASAVAAEPDAITLGRYTKVGDMLELAEQKVVQAPEDKRNVFGLLAMGKDESQKLKVAYDTLDKGVLAFLGKAELVYAESSSLEELRKIPAEKWNEVFAEFKPMDSSKAKLYRVENPGKPLPRNPVTWMPAVHLMPLVGRPSDFVACKTDGKLYLIQVTEHAEKAASVKLKIHPIQ